MTDNTYEIEENLRFSLSKRLRENFNFYLHDAYACSFNNKEKHITVLLFFYTDDMKEQAKADGIVTEIKEFCLKEISQVELEEYRTYGVNLICDSHENVVRTNGGNYLMYRR